MLQVLSLCHVTFSSTYLSPRNTMRTAEKVFNIQVY